MSDDEIKATTTPDERPCRVFVAKREYDRAGYQIVGIFTSQEAADEAIKRDRDAGYGQFHSVAELPLNQYFDIDEPGI